MLPAGVHVSRGGSDIPPYRAAGWRIVRMRGGVNKADVLSGLGGAFDFPSWYGRNLDALADCLTDLTEPTVLIWAGWELLAVEDPDSWAAIMDVLRERVDAEPPFAVWFVAG